MMKRNVNHKNYFLEQEKVEEKVENVKVEEEPEPVMETKIEEKPKKVKKKVSFGKKF